jgi:hypothetical protein
MGDVLNFSFAGAQREGRIGSRDDALRYLFAGRSTFTLVSGRTDRRLMFTVRATAARERYAVLAAGEVLGMVNWDGSTLGMSFRPSTERASLAILWFLDRLTEQGEVPANAELWHDGRCGRCRSVLTTQWAAARGVCADCAAHLMKAG